MIEVWQHPDPDRNVIRVQVDEDVIVEVDLARDGTEVEDVPGDWVSLAPAPSDA